MRRPVLAAAAAVLIVLAAACGDDGDKGVKATAAADPSPTATRAIGAAEVFPDLGRLGLARSAPEIVPAPAGLDIQFALYTGPTISARAEVRVYANDSEAIADFPLQAQGWRKPPPQLFGLDLRNVDGAPLDGPDQTVAYVSTASDAAGNRVWTDVFRVGRVVVVAHVLGSSEVSAGQVRAAMAEDVRAAVR